MDTLGIYKWPRKKNNTWRCAWNQGCAALLLVFLMWFSKYIMVYQTVSNHDCRPIFRTHWILSRSTVWKTNIIAIEQDHLYSIYLLKMVIVHSSASLPNLKVTSHFCSSNPQVTCWTSRNIPHLRTPRAWHAEILGVAKLPTDVTTTTEILNGISIILALNSSIFGESLKKRKRL